MPKYSQSTVPLPATTPLSEDVPRLSGCQRHQSVSQLFSFQLYRLGEPSRVPWAHFWWELWYSMGHTNRVATATFNERKIARRGDLLRL